MSLDNALRISPQRQSCAKGTTNIKVHLQVSMIFVKLGFKCSFKTKHD